MRTTLELPDALLLQAQAVATKNGLPFGGVVADAIQTKLMAAPDTTSKPWMNHFGSLRHLHSESERIAEIISEEFESIDEQAWR